MLCPNCPPALLTHSDRTAPLPGGRPDGPRAARGGRGGPEAGIKRTPIVTGTGEVGQRWVSMLYTRN